MVWNGTSIFFVLRSIQLCYDICQTNWIWKQQQQMTWVIIGRQMCLRKKREFSLVCSRCFSCVRSTTRELETVEHPRAMNILWDYQGSVQRESLEHLLTDVTLPRHNINMQMSLEINHEVLVCGSDWNLIYLGGRLS